VVRPGHRKTILRILALAGFVLLASAVYYVGQAIVIGAAYKAKILCSSVFLSKRSPEDVMREDLEGLLSMIGASIDFEAKSVTATFPGVSDQRAIFRDQLGCILLAGASDAEVPVPAGNTGVDASPRPVGHGAMAGFKGFAEGVPREVSQRKLGEALDEAFSEKNPDQPVRTRAVVVVYDGRIIAERYARGISADTALPGWSMTKSVTNALVGILVNQGKLFLDKPARLAEWSGPGDPRQAITLDQLLRMSSGLAFDESSGPVFSDVIQMLVRSRDVAGYALNKPLQHKPDSHWQYSSGTTNIISRIIRDSVGASVEAYHAFPRKLLFDRIGMSSAIMEVDASGTFVGSSYMYANARDWARFGLLYLQDGVWEGERILPPGWVRYSSMPSPTAPEGQYGAHFWTNGKTGMDSRATPLRNLPADTFFASGYEGQYVVVIPSRKLVVVRLGQTKNRKAWDLESFVSDIIAAISAGEPSSGG
jgi:CubicO group peptidase (beta-lactamase class C family)